MIVAGVFLSEKLKTCPIMFQNRTKMTFSPNTWAYIKLNTILMRFLNIKCCCSDWNNWSVGTVLSWLTARDCNNITPPLTILDKVVKLMKGTSDHRFDLVDPSGSRSSRLPSPFDTTLHNDFLQGVSTSFCNVSKIFHHLALDMR